MADNKLYKVAITLDGKYVHGKEYDKLVQVFYDEADGGDGCSYVSRKRNVNVRPGTDDTVWQKASDRGMQGEQGQAGQTGQNGASAGFGTPTASIVAGSGTPAVSITTSGPDTAKVFGFVFSNLQGVQGQTGETGATPQLSIGDVSVGAADSAAAVTITGTTDEPVLNFVIPKGAKGEQGNTGSSVDYAYELVNNCKTNDSTKGLTAAQGYKLENSLTVRAKTLEDADYIIRAVTSSSSLEDNENGTRLRLIFQVNVGDHIYISSTFKTGFSCGIWNSPANCVYAGSTGMLQSLVSGYVTTPVSTTSDYDGYLGISFSNNTTAIDASLKQTMLDSLTVFVGGDVANEINNINDNMMLVSKFDKSELPHIEENGIIYTTGARASHTDWTRYIFKNIGINRIVAKLYTSTSYLAIGFYNSEDWGQASFISGITGLNYTQNYDVAVPNGCKTIVICNRTVDLAAPTITLYQNDLKNETADIYERLESLNENSSDILNFLKDFSIIGKGDTASIKDIYSFIPGKKYRLSIDNPSWPIDEITLSNSYNCLYIAAYDENDTRIGDADLYSRTLKNYPCPQDIDFTAPSGTKYVRFGIRANAGAKIYFSITDITIASAVESHVPIGTIEGIGKINLSSKFKEETRNRYVNQTLFDTTDYSVGVQSLAVYNDTYAIYGICATDKTDSDVQKCGIVIDDIANRTVLAEFEIETENTKAHANNINLGNKYDADDILPLIYLSMTYNTKECLVLRVANDFSAYTEIQKITYAGSEHLVGASSYDWILDGEYIWAYGAYGNNSIEFVKFAKRPTTYQSVGFSDSDVLDTFIKDDLKIRQGAMALNGRFYLGLGYSTGSEYIKVVNINTHDIETVIPIGYEPEGITVYNGKITVCGSTYHFKMYSDAF